MSFLSHHAIFNVMLQKVLHAVLENIHTTEPDNNAYLKFRDQYAITIKRKYSERVGSGGYWGKNSTRSLIYSMRPII